jgi:hypothetical protein
MWDNLKDFEAFEMHFQRSEGFFFRNVRLFENISEIFSFFFKSTCGFSKENEAF